MTERNTPKATPLLHTTVRLASETDAYNMSVARRLVPGVTVMAYSRENSDDIAWGAQKYVEANTPEPDSSEKQALLARAMQFIEAGGFAVRVTVEIPFEAICNEALPTAAFDAQMQRLRILAN